MTDLSAEQIAALNAAAGGGGGTPEPDAPQISLVDQGRIQAAQAERTVAREKLDGLIANPAWRERMLANEPAALEEFQKLTVAISSDDPSPTFEGMAEGTRSRQFNAAVDAFGAQNDLPADVVADVKAGGKVSPQERAAAQAWFDRHSRDKEWSKRLVGGDVDAGRELALCNVILSADVDPNKTAKRAA